MTDDELFCGDNRETDCFDLTNYDSEEDYETDNEDEDEEDKDSE